MKIGRSRVLRLGALVSLLTATTLVCQRSEATPYASCLTNSGGVISFRLNESADNVKIVSDGGATTNDLGAMSAGLQSVSLNVAGTFRVLVTKGSGAGFITAVAPNRGGVMQISTDTNMVRFNNPRGLAINTDPASPYFGRVYVANQAAGSITNLQFAGTRTLGDGIYMLNADLTDAVGQGDTARTGGIDFTTGGTATPFRLTLGSDGKLFITDWSDSTGSLYMTDPDVAPGTGTNILGGPVGSAFPVTTNKYHGSITAAAVTGTLAGGNLTAYVIDEDLQADRTTSSATQRNSLWRHDIGATLPGPTNMPTLLGTAPWIRSSSQTMGMVRGTNGYFYACDYRSAGTEGGLFVLNSSGSSLWNSLTETRKITNSTAADFLRAAGGVAVSPYTPYMAVVNLESNGVTVLPLLANGLPDITNRLVFDFGYAGPQGRDVAFDAAGNLYVLSQGAQLMRVFSPGGTTTAITGSDGTFNLVRPPALSVLVTAATAREGTAQTAAFDIIRTTSDTSRALNVQFTLSGTASNGVDYGPIPLTATIPAGAFDVEIFIQPNDDEEAELTESVTLSLVGTSDYDIKQPANGTVYIIDNEFPRVTVTPQAASLSERFPNRTSGFTLTRYGDTNVTVALDYTLGGTATVGTDYVQPSAVTFSPGDVTKSLTVQALNDTDLEGDETIELTLNIGADYDPAPPSSATLILHDDEWVSAPAVFADDFEADSSGSWISRFGANNGIYDATVNFAYDYVASGIPLAPHSTAGTSKGLYVTVNKTNNTAAGSAGINLYPIGQRFSGDYALRFDMYLSIGSSNTTEHVTAGLNHSTLETNRVTQSTDANNTTRGGDGLWVAMISDASGNRDYTAYTTTAPGTIPAQIASRAATALTDVMPAPPYAFAGSPGNLQASNTRTWSTVQLQQISNVVTLLINDAVVLTTTNNTAFRAGDIMLGYNDQFDSIGGAAGFVLFDNVQVIRLSLAVQSMQRLPGNQVQLDFSAPPGTLLGDLHVQSTSSLSVPFADDNSAVISATATGFRAVADAGSAARYFRLRK